MHGFFFLLSLVELVQVSGLKFKKNQLLTTMVLANPVSVTAEHKYSGVVPHPGVGGVVV